MMFYTSLSFDILLIVFSYLLMDILIVERAGTKNWDRIFKHSICYAVGMTLLSAHFYTFSILKLPIIFLIQLSLYVIFIQRDIFELRDKEDCILANNICYHALCFTLTLTSVIL